MWTCTPAAPLRLPWEVSAPNVPSAQLTHLYTGLCSLPMPVREFRVTANEVISETALLRSDSSAPARGHARAIPVGTLVSANWQRGVSK